MLHACRPLQPRYPGPCHPILSTMMHAGQYNPGIQDAITCEWCSKSYYSNSTGTTMCDACPDNTVTDVGGADSITLCYCKEGYYVDSTASPTNCRCRHACVCMHACMCMHALAPVRTTQTPHLSVPRICLTCACHANSSPYSAPCTTQMPAPHAYVCAPGWHRCVGTRHESYCMHAHTCTHTHAHASTHALDAQAHSLTCIAVTSSACKGTNGTSCTSCPSNAACPGSTGSPQPLSGYWAEVTAPFTMYSCNPPWTCLGNYVCQEGYAGRWAHMNACTAAHACTHA